MRRNIENLINQLIQRHRLIELWRRTERDEFEAQVRNILGLQDVRRMQGPKLGELICSFERGDLNLKPGELVHLLELCDEPIEFQRALLSFFLARTIANLLHFMQEGMGNFRSRRSL